MSSISKILHHFAKRTTVKNPQPPRKPPPPKPLPPPPPPLNPNTKPSHQNENLRRIGGIRVDFPYEPYDSQVEFMGKVIETLNRAEKEGHCHALLESPTGTGKSLSLICSALAWQKNHHRSKKKIKRIENQKEIMRTPTIFYASRTHSQLTQLIREYKKTAYRVPMAVLGSRKHYCTNKHICGKANIDVECKLLLKNREVGCPEFKNVVKVTSHPSLQKGGCHEAHDIEDLVKVGQSVKGCSYFAAQSLAKNARLIFCPYSYIINPVIRRAMDIDLEGAIVIFDEAHNIEDMARAAGSVDVDEDALIQLQTELRQLCETDEMTYQPLHEMIEGMVSWINRRKSTLTNNVSSWSGDKASKELEEANISQQRFPDLRKCARKAIKASEAQKKSAFLSGMSANILESLFSSLGYFFSRDGIHVVDYQLALRRYIKRDSGKSTGIWTYTLSLWCLNPAVVFKGIADTSLSVILTSGTLSPMNSFSSELGVSFETCLEAPHVIDVESQLWAAVISSGPDNYPLNASYHTADKYAFQDELGKSVEEICKVVPGGCLVFFPSFNLMEQLCSRWTETGQWSRLNAQKPLFVEPRGGDRDDLELVLKGYYDSIRNGSKVGLNNPNSLEWKQTSRKGAAFLAVCRGKVSEGIDFSDENARLVIIVGIPFANVKDIQVALKKGYNNKYKSSKNLRSGNDWYCQLAYRALNQAAGRCIRHRDDYGAIIFLDERFGEERNRRYMSKWLKNSIKQYDNFDQSLEGLKSFFEDVKEKIGSPKSVLPSKGDQKSQRGYIYFECDLEKNSRRSSPQTTAVSPYKLDSTTVKETPMDGAIQSVTVDEYSCSLGTPTKEVTANPSSHIPKIESSLNLKFMGSPLVNHLKQGHICNDAMISMIDAVCRLERAHETNCSNNNFKMFHVPQPLTLDKCETSCAPSVLAMEKTLQISCLLCGNPLGLPENNFKIPCSMTSLSKIHLASIWKGKLEPPVENPPSVPIVVSDISSVDQRLCGRTTEGAAGQGVWSKEDGCVFNTIFCPFCSNNSNCLGLQVMATDASNIQLLNKMLLYLDRLEIKDLEESKNKGSSPGSGSCGSGSPVFNSIEKFAYSPQ